MIADEKLLKPYVASHYASNGRMCFARIAFIVSSCLDSSRLSTQSAFRMLKIYRLLPANHAIVSRHRNAPSPAALTARRFLVNELPRTGNVQKDGNGAATGSVFKRTRLLLQSADKSVRPLSIVHGFHKGPSMKEMRGST